MRRGRRWLALLLAVVIAVGLLPTAALATEAEWANEAVATLNKIYGVSVFSADDGTMTEGDAASIASSAGWTTSEVNTGSTTLLSRGKACEVLADVFKLPVDTANDETAIQYLYGQNIINGVSENNLNETGNVTKAEFAVLTYRVLNSVGGGKGIALEGLKPGTPEYMAWMYLAVRKCVPFVVGEGAEETPINVNQSIGTATGIETYKSSALKPNYTDIYDVSTEPKNGKAIWAAWEDALGDTNIGGIENFTANDYNGDDTLLKAATKIVGQFMEEKSDKKDLIFHDVTPDSWFYDGIMYLANQNIVIGYGDGQFGPNDITPRFQFAVLLSIMDGTIKSTDTSPDRIYRAVQNVVNKEYMTGTKPTDENWEFSNDPDWGAATKTTREEAVVGILAMIKQKYSIETTSANTAILDRFTDGHQVAAASEPYLAYAVSMGLLSGTSENTLSPKDPVTRAQTGVLLYRTLIGLDASKMHDYEQNVQYALEGGN